MHLLIDSEANAFEVSGATTGLSCASEQDKQMAAGDVVMFRRACHRNNSPRNEFETFFAGFEGSQILALGHSISPRRSTTNWFLEFTTAE